MIMIANGIAIDDEQKHAIHEATACMCQQCVVITMLRNLYAYSYTVTSTGVTTASHIINVIATYIA